MLSADWADTQLYQHLLPMLRIETLYIPLLSPPRALVASRILTCWIEDEAAAVAAPAAAAFGGLRVLPIRSVGTMGRGLQEGQHTPPHEPRRSPALVSRAQGFRGRAALHIGS